MSLPKEIIVGVQKVMQELNWNKKQLKWTVTHSTDKFTKQHQILLDLTIVSSQRVVSVDGEVKLKQMCSFGFKCEFDINPFLKGKIVQEGIEFLLYLNGKSFTECSKQHYSYQPPIANSDLQSQYDSWKLPAKKQPTVPSLKQTLSERMAIPEKLPENNAPRPQKQLSNGEERTETSIKSMQNEAMKILIAQKKAKKDLALKQ